MKNWLPTYGDFRIFTLDLETLGRNVHAPVVSISCLHVADVIDGKIVTPSKESFYDCFLDLDEQLRTRVPSSDSLNFWLTAPEAARQKIVNSEKVSTRDAVCHLYGWWNHMTFKMSGIVWCRGTDFDIAIMKELFRDQGLPTPWEYNQVRDLRTWGDIPCGQFDSSDLVPHISLDDCRHAGRHLIEIYRSLGIVS